MPGSEFDLSIRLAASRLTSAPDPIVSCADLTERLMADYGTRIGLDAISRIVLAVLAERGRAPADADLAGECIRRLDGLRPPPFPALTNSGA